MASDTKVYKARKKIKARKRGRKRKNRLAREGTTPNKEAVFGPPLVSATAAPSPGTPA